MATLSPEAPLKLRVRKLVQGFSDKDLAEQHSAMAQQLVKQVASRGELHAVLQEIFVDLEHDPPVARKYRYRCACAFSGEAVLGVDRDRAGGPHTLP